MFHLQQKSFLKLLDLSPEEITGLLDLAADLKAKKKAGIPDVLAITKRDGSQITIPLADIGYKDNTEEFTSDDIITDWLMGYSPVKDITYVRGFLGRMLFSQDDALKKVKVLSGGEKVRCMLSKMMISGANCLILDEPTNHLDMESIQALNNGLIRFSGVELFSCHDHQFIETTANRIMEIMPGGKLIDKITTYDDYLASDEMARKRTIYIAKKEDDEN